MSERMTVEERVKSLAQPVQAEAPSVEDAQPEAVPDVAIPQDVRGDVETDVTPVDTDMAPDPKSEKANQMWRDLKAQAKLAEELQVKLDARSETTTEEAEKLRVDIEDLRTARQEDQARFDDDYGKIDITRQRSFQREHDDKINQSLHWVTNILVKREGLDKEAAEAVARKAFAIGDYQQRSAYLMDEAPSTQALLDNELMKADGLRESRADAIQNWQATKVRLAEVDARLSKASTNKNVQELVESAVAELSASGNYYYSKSKGTSAGAADWNRNYDTRILAVNQVMLKQDQAETTALVADGMTARLIREDLNRAEAELKVEKAKNAKFKALKPGVDGTRPITADYTPPKDGERMLVNDRLLGLARAPRK